MRKYEIMFIVKPDLEEGTIKEVFESMKGVLESKKAKILDTKDMGQRELAYEIKKYKNEEENAEAINEFDRLALINENIIRHLVVRIDE